MRKFRVQWCLFLVLSLLLFAGCGGGGSSSVIPPPNPDFDLTSADTQSIVEITPTFNKTSELIDGVELLSNNLTDKLVEFNENKDAGTAEIVFNLDDDESFDKSINDILILTEKAGITSEYPYPFKKILSIDTDENKINVKTIDVPMTQVFETLDLSFTQEVTVGEVDVASLAPGITVSKAPFIHDESVRFNLDTELINTGNVSVSAIGNIDMKLNFFFNLSIEENTLYGFGTALTASQSSTLGFKATGEYSGAIEKSLGNIINKKMRFSVPVAGVPVPVWIDVKIPFEIGLTINAGAEVETKYTRTDNGTMGIIYNRGTSNWTTINTYNKSEAFTPPKLSGQVAIGGFVGPKLETTIYDIGGPWVTFYGALLFNAAGNSDYPLGYEWELKAGVKSEAGAELGKLKKILSNDIPELEVTLLDPATSDNAVWPLANGPELTGLRLASSSINMLIEKDYNLELVDVMAEFGNSSAEILYTDTKLSFEADSGTISGNTYTAPSTAGEYEITYTYSYKNQYSTGNEIEKTAVLSVNVSEPKILDSLTVNPATASVVKDGTLNLDDFTVTAHYTDSTSDVVKNVDWIAFSGGGSISGTTYTAPSAAGNATIRVAYEEGEVIDHADIAVTITETAPSGGDEGVPGEDSAILLTDASSGGSGVTFTLNPNETKVFKVQYTQTSYDADVPPSVYVQGNVSPDITMIIRDNWNTIPTSTNYDEETIWNTATSPLEIGSSQGDFGGSPSDDNIEVGYYYFTITNTSSVNTSGNVAAYLM